MFVRKYYSLCETAEILSGDPRNRDDNERIIKDFIHLAARKEIYLAVLIDSLKARLFKNAELQLFGVIIAETDENGRPIGTRGGFPANERYFHTGCTSDNTHCNIFYVSILDIRAYEAAIANKNNLWVGYKIKKVRRTYQDESEYALFPSDFDIELNPTTLHVFTRDIEAYQNKKNALKQNSDELADYLDPKHPLHSKELKIAIDAWMSVLKDNPAKPNRGTRKGLIEKWLNENYKDKRVLSDNAKERIALMLNPDSSGGAPKS